MRKASIKFGLAAAAVIFAAAGAGAWLALTYRGNDARAVFLPDRVMTVLPQPRALAPFALHDQNGQAFDLARLRGKWSFVFFGFSSCHDVCPATLAALVQMRDEIARGEGGDEQVQLVFVSVDPGRDDPATLKRYVGAFDAGLIGATGADAEIRRLADQLGAAYEVLPGSDPKLYPVVHSPAVYLLDPQARYHAVLTPPFDVKVIGARFRDLRRLDG
jgi:protein SCO1/2